MLKITGLFTAVTKYARPLGALVVALSLSACGTQINTLRKMATAASDTSVSGVPPSMTSLTVTNPSPTRGNPLNLSWGIEVGTHTQYCILENSTNSALCIWLSGALPATYTDSAPDGNLALSAFLKNTYGTSTVVTSNTFVIDRTPPGLASVTVTNASPTNTVTYGLSYGAVTNAPYSDYCILENDTNVLDCAWTAGTLPASYNVLPVNNSKDLSVWIRDAAGNVSTRVTSASVALDTVIPTVTITTPASGAVLGAAGINNVAVSGACSETGRNVVLSGAASATVPCVGGAWSTNVDLSGQPDGSLTLNANHSDAAGNNAVQASVTFTKSTVGPSSPSISIAAGAAYTTITNPALTLGATGATEMYITNTAGCGSGGVWEAYATSKPAWTLGQTNATATVYVKYRDATLTESACVSDTIIHDNIVPTVAISNPATNSPIYAINVTTFVVNGTCSENTRNVVISGAATATVTCTAGAWTATLDFSSAADGPVTINVNHSDAAGNNAVQASRTFTKNTGAAPISISIAAGATYTNVNPVALTLSAANETEMYITNVAGCGSGGVWEAYSTSKASWTLGQTNATATVYVKYRDAALNETGCVSDTIIHDNTNPTVAITAPPVNSYVNVGNLTAFAISGTCSEAGRTVSISAAAGAVTATPVCTGGNTWSTSLDLTPLGQGSFTVTVDHTDAAGNNATQDSRTFIKDTGVPTVTFTTGATYANSSTVTTYAIGGACSENTRNVVITGNAAANGATATVTCAAGAWSTTIDLTVANQGAVTLYADHSDAAGNAATQASRTLTKDTVVPNLASANITNTSPTNSTTYNLSYGAVTNGPYTDYCILENSTTVGSCSWTTASLPASTTVSATENAKVLSIWLRDVAGNVSTRVDTNSVTLDTTAPTLAFTSPAVNSWMNASNYTALTVGGTCSAADNGRTITFGGSATGSVTCGAGTFSGSANFTAAADGNVTITADMSDAAGNNATQASLALKKDIIAPALSVTAPNGGESWYVGDSQNITWTASDSTSGLTGSTVALTYKINAGSANSINATAPNTGTYAWTVPNAPSALVKVQATITDVAGNSTTDDSNANFTILTPTAPSAPTTLIATAGYTQVALSWTASATGTPTPTYEVLRSTTSGSGYVSVITGLTGTTYTNTGLTNGTPYYFVVRATNVAGTSGYSNEATATPNLFPSFAMDFRTQSYQPTVGTQTFTFARADTTWAATNYGSNGKLRYAPHNLRPHSENFDDPSWTVLGWGFVNADAAVAPDGTTSADLLVQSAGTHPAAGLDTVADAVIPTGGVPMTCSVYAKASGFNYMAVKLFNHGGTDYTIVYFDLTTGKAKAGAASTGTQSYIAKGVDTIGNGWYRVWMSAYADPTEGVVACGYFIASADGNGAVPPNQVGDDVKGIYLWGAQLEMNRNPSVYLKTTTAARYDGPRYDFDPVTKAALGMRFDENSTNLVTYSEQFDNAAWTKYTSTVTANSTATLDPMGNYTSDKLTDNATNDYHQVYQTITKAASALPYVESFYAKAGTLTKVEAKMESAGGSVGAYVDLTNCTSGGSFATTWTGNDITITDVGNGWCRIALTGITNTDTTFKAEIGTANAAGAGSYSGTGKYVYIWGAQVEQPDQTNGSVSLTGTYYIPTWGSTVSRANEYVQTTGGLGAWYSTTGTWLLDWRMGSKLDNGANSATVMRIHEGTNPLGKDYRICTRPGSYVGFQASDGTTDHVAAQFTASISGTSNFKAAFTNVSGDMVARTNGLTAGFTNTARTMTATPTSITFGQDKSGYYWEPLTGWIREARFYNVRATDTEIASLSTQTATTGFTDDFSSASMLSYWRTDMNSPDCIFCTNQGYTPAGISDVGTITQASGTVSITAPSGSWFYTGYITKDAYDLTNASAQIKLSTLYNSSGSPDNLLYAIFDDLQLVGFGVTGGNLYVEQVLGTPGGWSTWGTLAYDPVNHKYLRIRHNAGTLYFDTSPDGTTWTNRFSEAAPYSVKGTRFDFQVGDGGSSGAITPAVWDDFSTTATKNY